MRNPSGENLSQYVKRIMKEKSLTVRDVEKLSGKRITASYINSIMNETATNPSVKKLAALAYALDVDEIEVLKAALN